MNEKLCIFCTNFKWKSETIWGMGSTMTGPMMTGGDATCSAGRYADWPQPADEEEWRALIVRAENCDAYKQVVIAKS